MASKRLCHCQIAARADRGKLADSGAKASSRSAAEGGIFRRLRPLGFPTAQIAQAPIIPSSDLDGMRETKCFVIAPAPECHVGKAAIALANLPGFNQVVIIVSGPVSHLRFSVQESDEKILRAFPACPYLFFVRYLHEFPRRNSCKAMLTALTAVVRDIP